ncbi:MAG TPA: NUDIX hydrolase [Cyclobacteriaceae bacterium]|nr:NUDIX hydrolase [Cyclobacteriaceae bacterium]
MDRASLIRDLQFYQSKFEEERQFVKRFLELLKHPDCFQRTHLPGHITGSSWIVNQDRTKTLLVHHAKLNKWVQPGGHADGEENILNVALREGEEETGLRELLPELAIFDIDVHLIPARKDFLEHFHHDIRFLVKANEKEEIIVSDESHDVKWVLLSELENYTKERSVLRMKEKLL